jgi:hypothetical protein
MRAMASRPWVRRVHGVFSSNERKAGDAASILATEAREVEHIGEVGQYFVSKGTPRPNVCRPREDNWARLP